MDVYAELEKLSIEHYNGGETELSACDTLIGDFDCDCGADEHNASIDAIIEYLKTKDKNSKLTIKLPGY